MGTPAPGVHTPLRKRPACLGLGHASQDSAPPSSPRGFASLHELLEREGYKETRIVTPVSKCAQALAGLATNDGAGDAPLSSPPPQQYPDIQAWMKGMIATQAPLLVYQEPRRLRASQSEAALASDATLQRRRSVIWDASRAYRDGAPALPAKAAPAIPSVPFAFLAAPAQPIVSHEAAVVVQENTPPRPVRTLRSTASKDLLSKTLKRQASSKNLRAHAPVCTCGRAREPIQGALPWRKPSADIEPPWHGADCPIRKAWEASATCPVPPAPPSFVVSSPRGISKPLSLSGKEYDAKDASASPGFAKWPSVSGLYTLFQGETSETSASRPAPRRLPRARRLPRTTSTPHFRPDRAPSDAEAGRGGDETSAQARLVPAAAHVSKDTARRSLEQGTLRAKPSAKNLARSLGAVTQEDPPPTLPLAKPTKVMKFQRKPSVRAAGPSSAAAVPPVPPIPRAYETSHGYTP